MLKELYIVQKGEQGFEQNIAILSRIKEYGENRSLT